VIAGAGQGRGFVLNFAAHAGLLADHMIHDCEWDPQWFEREALPIFIGSYRGFR